MRWRQPANDETRIRCGFLWWPKTLRIQGTTVEETRWLEFASWEQWRAPCSNSFWIDSHWYGSEATAEHQGD